MSCCTQALAPLKTHFMAPPLLTLRDINLTFGSTPLLSGSELSVSDRDRVCLVGRNGSGKSTLLKVAAGLVEPDNGEIFVQPGTTVRYLPQEPDFQDFKTTFDYAQAGCEEETKILIYIQDVVRIGLIQNSWMMQ